MVAYLPPGWPTGVHPPGSEEFERTAVAWLLDVVPPDYRMHGVLRRHPVALATLARRHLAACVEGARQGYRTARTELGDVLPVSGLDAVLAAYRSEGSRLVTAARAADLLEQALRGQEFTPPLHDPASGSPLASAPPRPPTPSEVSQRPDAAHVESPPGQAEPSSSAVRRGQQATPEKRRQKAASPGKASTPGKQQKQPTRGKQRRPQAVA
jgi:hypothetical protein